MALLEVENLQTHFRTPDGVNRAVDGVSFSVNEGETLAIVGESGCGKSITAMALLGLLPHQATTSGSIRFDQQELLGRADSELQRLRGNRIGMIFQEPMTALNPVRRIGAQMADVLRAHTAGADIEATLVGLLEQVQLREPQAVLKAYPHQLSGGQRQRIAIARALILEPQILLLDEPTSALDASVQAEVLNLLEDLRRRRGLTFVMVSHDLAVVTHLCERLMVMQRGQTVELVSSADLAASRVSHPYTRNLMEASTGFRRTGESP